METISGRIHLRTKALRTQGVPLQAAPCGPWSTYRHFRGKKTKTTGHKKVCMSIGKNRERSWEEGWGGHGSALCGSAIPETLRTLMDFTRARAQMRMHSHWQTLGMGPYSTVWLNFCLFRLVEFFGLASYATGVISSLLLPKWPGTCNYCRVKLRAHFQSQYTVLSTTGKYFPSSAKSW